MEYCDQYGCHMELVGGWVQVTQTATILVDTNAEPRRPLEIVTLIAVLAALVILISMIPRGGRRRFEPDIADLSWQEIQGY